MFSNIMYETHNHTCKKAMDLTSNVVDMSRLLLHHNVIEKNYDSFNERKFLVALDYNNLLGVANICCL